MAEDNGRDHVDEALQRARSTQASSSEQIEKTVEAATQHLLDRLRPHTTLSDGELSTAAAAVVHQAVADVLATSSEVFAALLDVIHSIRAHSEARDLPDAPPDDWTI